MNVCARVTPWAAAFIVIAGKRVSRFFGTADGENPGGAKAFRSR